MIRVCPKRDAICPHGMDCPYTIDRYNCSDETAALPPAAATEPVADVVERLTAAARWQDRYASGVDADTMREAATLIQTLTASLARANDLIGEYSAGAKQLGAIVAHNAARADKAEADLARANERVGEVERALDFVRRWAWRENTKLSDTERLSAIKYHPAINVEARDYLTTTNGEGET